MPKRFVSPGIAYEVTLKGLSSIWTAVENAVNIWVRYPNQKYGIVISPVRGVINRVLEDLNGILAGLKDATAKDLVGVIVEKLKSFNEGLTAPVESPSGILEAWRTVVRELLDDLKARVPELETTPAYMRVEGRTAA